MGRRSLGSVRCRCTWTRSCHPCRDGVRPRGQDPRVARQNHCQSRRLHVDLLVVGADLSLRDSVIGPIRNSANLLRGRCGLHQYGAGRCLSRRRPPGSDLRRRAARRSRRPGNGPGPRRATAQELHKKISAPDAGYHVLRCRRL
jgi:hypothetical protein